METSSRASPRPQVSCLPVLAHITSNVHAIWQNFPDLVPGLPSSPSHQRNANLHSLLCGPSGENASSHLDQCSPPAKQGARFQRSRGRSGIPLLLSHPPKPFRVIATLPNYNSGEGKRGERLSATPANSNCRRITLIPCWLPHLSPSSSPAKAHFPLTSG